MKDIKEFAEEMVERMRLAGFNWCLPCQQWTKGAGNPYRCRRCTNPYKGQQNV